MNALEPKFSGGRGAASDFRRRVPPSPDMSFPPRSRSRQIFCTRPTYSRTMPLESTVTARHSPRRGQVIWRAIHPRHVPPVSRAAAVPVGRRRKLRRGRAGDQTDDVTGLGEPPRVERLASRPTGYRQSGDTGDTSPFNRPLQAGDEPNRVTSWLHLTSPGTYQLRATDRAQVRWPG